MEKKFSKFEIATIKRTAQNVNPMVVKKTKLKEQIEALQAEYDQLSMMQEQYEASIKTMTGGYSTEDLVTKVVETTNAVDKAGRPIKITKYVLKYPETVIPTDMCVGIPEGTLSSKDPEIALEITGTYVGGDINNIND